MAKMDTEDDHATNAELDTSICYAICNPITFIGPNAFCNKVQRIESSSALLTCLSVSPASEVQCSLSLPCVEHPHSMNHPYTLRITTGQKSMLKSTMKRIVT